MPGPSSGGVISTYAGSSCGDGGDGQAATTAQFRSLLYIAFDASDNLLISDYQNNRVRRVDRQSGIVSTIAGGGSGTLTNGMLATLVHIGQPGGIAVDKSSGTVYWTEIYPSPAVRMVNASGFIFTLDISIGRPAGLTLRKGGLVVAE